MHREGLLRARNGSLHRCNEQKNHLPISSIYMYIYICDSWHCWRRALRKFTSIPLCFKSSASTRKTHAHVERIEFLESWRKTKNVRANFTLRVRIKTGAKVCVELNEVVLQGSLAVLWHFLSPLSWPDHTSHLAFLNTSRAMT